MKPRRRSPSNNYPRRSKYEMSDFSIPGGYKKMGDQPGFLNWDNLLFQAELLYSILKLDLKSLPPQDHRATSEQDALCDKWFVDYMIYAQGPKIVPPPPAIHPWLLVRVALAAMMLNEEKDKNSPMPSGTFEQIMVQFTVDRWHSEGAERWLQIKLDE